MTFGMITKRMIFKIIYLHVLSVLLIAGVPAKAGATENLLVIDVMYPGRNGAAQEELITIFNNSGTDTDVTDLCVIYMSASGLTRTELGCLTPPGPEIGLMLPGFNSLVFATSEFSAAYDIPADILFKPGIAASSGHILLIDQADNEKDRLGWGGAASPEQAAAMPPISGKGLLRASAQDMDNMRQDEGNNLIDFFQGEVPHLESSGLYEITRMPTDKVSEIRITEVLPNVSGADTGKEFIEFYNPGNQPVSLGGYVLNLITSSVKSVILPEVTLGAGKYMALSETLLGVTLPNSSASLSLHTPTELAIGETISYESPEDDLSWGFFNGIWKYTSTPTPSKENILSEPDSCHAAVCLSGTGGNKAPKPCRDDQYRSSETGRCRKKITVKVNKVPCRADQYRSPESGRCRKMSSQKNLTACRAGQVRNPDTKRCRKFLSAESAKKPCAPGQARNPETNRCKKTILKAGDITDVKDVSSPILQNNYKWWAAGVAATGSVGYAGYEWRREFLSAVAGLKAKVPFI